MFLGDEQPAIRSDLREQADEDVQRSNLMVCMANHPFVHRKTHRVNIENEILPSLGLTPRGAHLHTPA